jgi:hypothetical protein
VATRVIGIEYDVVYDALRSLDLHPCPGYELDIPEPAADNYPLSYHLMHPSNPWWFDTQACVARASTCDRVVTGTDGAPIPPRMILTLTLTRLG